MSDNIKCKYLKPIIIKNRSNGGMPGPIGDTYAYDCSHELVIEANFDCDNCPYFEPKE